MQTLNGNQINNYLFCLLIHHSKSVVYKKKVNQWFIKKGVKVASW